MERHALGEMVNHKKGFAFSSKEYSSSGTQVVRVSDFTLDSISTDDAIYISEKKEYEQHRLKEGDILIQTVGSWANNPQSIVGKVVRVPAECEGAYLNQNIVKIIPKDVNADYLFYLLKANRFPIYCVNRGQGAANQASITLDTIMKFKCFYHHKNEQAAIAESIKQFDDLLYCNTKKIRVLEQEAAQLYEEWFVRFRFPGYRDVDFSEDNPRGWIYGNREKTFRPKTWHYGELRELGEFVRGKNITAEKMEEGDVPVISAGISPSGFHNEANVFGESITISASGANAGYLSYHLNNIWAADCSYYQHKDFIWFVYNSLKFLQPVLSNMQAGAAQPHVYPKHVNRVSIMIPDNKYLKMYCDAVAPMYDQIRLLNAQNEILVKQRDMVLPRIMSGKMEIKNENFSA